MLITGKKKKSKKVNVSRSKGKESILQNPYDHYDVGFFKTPYGGICL